MPHLGEGAGKLRAGCCRRKTVWKPWTKIDGKICWVKKLPKPPIPFVYCVLVPLKNGDFGGGCPAWESAASCGLTSPTHPNRHIDRFPWRCIDHIGWEMMGMSHALHHHNGQRTTFLFLFFSANMVRTYHLIKYYERTGVSTPYVCVSLPVLTGECEGIHWANVTFFEIPQTNALFDWGKWWSAVGQWDSKFEWNPAIPGHCAFVWWSEVASIHFL